MSVPKVSAEKCTGCEECKEACPQEAISMVNEVAVIDPELCSECLACIDACPAEAIAE